MFNIVSPQDFFAKLEADYADFKEQPGSARHALNCIITAYHLHEWVWGGWLKKDYEARRRLGVRDLEIFQGWLRDKWSDFFLAKGLTNGSKHFNRDEMDKTKRVAGYGVGRFGGGRYGQPYLLIDRGIDCPGRWLTAEQLIDGAIAFWRNFFQEHRPMSLPDT